MPYQENLKLFANRRPTTVKLRVDCLPAPAEHEPRPVERIRLREYEGRKTVGVVVFGRSGVGQSTALDGVADALGIPRDSRIDAGQLIRNASGQTTASLGWGERLKKVDTGVDGIVDNVMDNADPENPVAINAKVGGFRALMYQPKHPDSVIFRVLITCQREEAARRIYCRELGQVADDIAGLAVKLDNRELSRDEYNAQLAKLEKEQDVLVKDPAGRMKWIIENKQAKEAKDRQRWAAIYPELRDYVPGTSRPRAYIGKDLYKPTTRISVPLNRGFIIPRGTKIVKNKAELPLYDAKFPNTDLTKDETVQSFINLLIETGVAERIKPSDSRDSESGLSQADIEAIARAADANPVFDKSADTQLQ